MSLKEKDADAAFKYCERRLEISERLAAERETQERLRELRDCCQQMSRVLRARGNEAEAKRFDGRAEALLRKLINAELADSSPDGFKISAAPSRGKKRGLELEDDPLKALGSVKSAADFNFRKLRAGRSNLRGTLGELSGVLRRSLGEAPVALRSGGVDRCTRLGLFLQKRGRKKGAARLFRRALALAEKNLDRRKYVDSYEDAAVACYNLGAMEEDEAHRALLLRSYKIFTELARQFPGDKLYAERRATVKKALAGRVEKGD